MTVTPGAGGRSRGTCRVDAVAADVSGVPTVLVARTDAESAKLITSDVDERDHEFLTGERTPEGFFRLKDGTGVDHCIKRGLAFAKHADLLWWETSNPNLDDARRFAEDLKIASYKVSKIVRRERKSRAPAPYTT